MDTGTDFIQPEFLDILFFQQKNLVIFPYVDLKHLHYLELFTVGYTIVNLESTALHNLKEILEFETNNSYSQNPSLFIISNVDKPKVKEIMELDNIHCIINSNENVGELANGGSFIFFNKKSNQFLNYDTNSDLGFENLLISTSKSQEILQDRIQKIKMTATKIFTELNQEEKPDIPSILKEYDEKYWQQIINYTSLYYDIEIPVVLHNTTSIKPNSIKSNTDETRDEFSEEYEVCVSTHKAIGKEFIQLIHEYRKQKVNSSHLELEELFSPKELYNYLRNRHWKSGIPEKFIQDWIKMKMSGVQLDEDGKLEFERILKLLPVDKVHPYQQILKRQREVTPNDAKVVTQVSISESIPSVKKEWPIFKEWLENKLTTLERLIDTLDAEKIIGSNLLVSHPSEIKSKTVFVDTTNILNEDKDSNGKLKVANISKLSAELRKNGFSFEHIIDASSKYRFDNIKQLEELISKKIVYLAPHGIKADKYILKCAERFKGKILSNDVFRDHQEEYDKRWIYDNKFTCKFIHGEFIII